MMALALILFITLATH